MRALARIGQIARTVRHLRPRQLAAQAVHAVRGVRRPVPYSGPAPQLAPGAPAAPFLPAPAHARVEPGPCISLIGRTVDFSGGVDWDFAAEGRLFAYHLHQFDYLRGEGVEPGLRATLLADWIERHGAGVGWDPHPISLRTLSWAKLLLTPGALPDDPGLLADVRHSMARQLETLSRGVEVRLQGNHLLSNLIAVVFGGLLFDGRAADRWLDKSGQLEAEIARQVGGDGLHEERSPMYHALLLEGLLDLLNLSRGRAGRASPGLIATIESAAERMLGALAVMTHPDGEIALFADSAFAIAHPFATLARYAESLGLHAEDRVDRGLLPEAGYLRLASGPFTLIASVGGPAPAHQPGHAHCDALAFELSCGSDRLVTDTGVYEYVPGARRRAARETRSHATIEVDGREQGEIWSAHRVGGRPIVVVEEVEPGVRCTASCRSWSTRDTLHRRSFVARGGTIEIRDALLGTPRPVRLALPLAPGLEPRLVHDNDGATEAHVRLEDGRHLRIALPVAARWHIERADYYPRFGAAVERACLVGVSSEFDTGTFCFELLSD